MHNLFEKQVEIYSMVAPVRAVFAHLSDHAHAIASEHYRVGSASLGSIDEQTWAGINACLTAQFRLGLNNDSVGGDDSFFSSLSCGVFKIATTVRRPHELDNADSPDMFHDLIGHVPWLCVPEVACAIRHFGQVWANASGPRVVLRQPLRQLWFHVMEFGLVTEGARRAAFGGGLLSSPSAWRVVAASDVVSASLNDILCEPMSDIGLPTRYFLHESTASLLVFFNTALHNLETS
jgi:hypothetical protein